MKPRTKLELEIYELSKERAPLTKAQKKWAFAHCMDHKGFATKTRVICMDCGKTFSTELVIRKRATCSHCSTRLKVEQSRKSTDYQREYFALAELEGQYQVVRNFEIIAQYKKGVQVDIYICEILQYWISPNLKMTMVGHNHNTQGFCDSWGSDWSIRKNQSRYNYYGDKFRIYPYKYLPDSVFKPEYSKHGIDHKLYGVFILSDIKEVLSNPRAETLLKAKQFNLLAECMNSVSVARYWPSIKICLRNRYKVKDAKLYIDYLDLLSYFRKDLHNAHYVCPRDLKKEHDRLMKKKDEIRRKQEIVRKRKQAIKDEKWYRENKYMFFGLMFIKGKISIKVLESVQEFVEESDQLKHCLFTNDYHKKANSLIFSAMVNGVKTETIEVSLKSFKVVQSRGLHNNPTIYHDKIVSLIESNMDKISAIAARHNETYAEAV